jgi:transposase InsO family protein
MTTYAAQRAAKRQERRRPSRLQAEPAAWTQLRIEAEDLRAQRRRQRWERRAADEAWRVTRQERRWQDRVWHSLPRSEKHQQRSQRQAAIGQWRERKQARRRELAVRRAEDGAWRQARQALRERQAQLEQAAPPTMAWLAILVSVDNCTRHCSGLPCFTAGAHVTSEMVVAALGPLLPANLQFLISDNGVQFTAEAFAALTRTANFIHVRIAPHRACTNGIAERFVQTLKDWLAGRSWTTPQEMQALLAEFQAFYNDRPHQGAELNGLSPNEYARRLTIRSTC